MSLSIRWVTCDIANTNVRSKNNSRLPTDRPSVSRDSSVSGSRLADPLAALPSSTVIVACSCSPVMLFSGDDPHQLLGDDPHQQHPLARIEPAALLRPLRPDIPAG